MKATIQSLIASGIIAVLMLTSSCGGDTEPEPEPTAGDAVLANLASGQWKVSSVTVDGADKSSLFTNLTITFSTSAPGTFSGSFSATNGGPVWPATGTWTITDPAVGSSLSRGDGTTIQLTEVTTNSLKMSLAWSKNTFGPGKTGSVKGQHIFSFSK
jgi:hypothetical protein